MNKRKLLYCLSITLAGLGIGLAGKAQQDTAGTIGHVSIASPTAASLGKYGDIPVSYHTGIPQISLPIYTVKSGSLQLPVGLSYHAGGLKVQEPAGWVGAGWALNAGGVITRTVVGAPDDRGYASSNTLQGHYTDFGYNSYYGSEAQGDVDLALTRGFADGEPDLYFFNFGNYTGKFYFNDDRTPMLVPEQDFKIQPTLTSGVGFSGFVITTPDGTRYYFGKTGNSGSVDPVEITNPSTLQNGPANTTAATSSWFLNKVVSADGMDSINLSYQTENYSYYSVASYPVTDNQYLKQTSQFEFLFGLNLTKNLVQGVRLSQISFANGSLTFTPSASPRSDLSKSTGFSTTPFTLDEDNTNSYALGSITITDNTGFCKKDSFYTSYFYDGTALQGATDASKFYYQYNSLNLHTDQYRLRLDSVREIACDGSQSTPPYRFTYFSEGPPRRLSFGIDHWGYANNAGTNTGLVPTFTQIIGGVPTVTPGANRDASWPTMRAGTLAQITYPTGGNTSFDFEPKNVYSWTTMVLQEVLLRPLAIHQPGQTNITQTLSFIVVPTGTQSTSTCVFNLANSATNTSPEFSIYDASGNRIYYSGFVSQPSFVDSMPLAPGNYSATLDYSPGTTPDHGATLQINEWEYMPVTTTQTVGGLRIKTITHNDGLTSNNIVTSYDYTGGTGNATLGTLYSVPVYVQILRNDQIKEVWGPPMSGSNPNGCQTVDGFNAHGFYISAGSIQPLSTVQGENFGYNEVDVTQTGNGRSVYRYYSSNLWSQNIQDVCVRSITQSSLCSASIPTYPAPPIPFEFMRDELQYEGYFNQGGQLLKEAYHYPSFAYDPLTTPGHIGVNMPAFFTYTEYQLQTAKKVRDSVVSIQYDPSLGGQFTTMHATYYSSPWHNQPTKTISSTSTGDILTAKTRYAMDFRVPGCDAIPDSLPYYLNAVHNDSVTMLQNIDLCSPQAIDASNCRAILYDTFRVHLAVHRQNFIHFRRRSYAPDSANLQSACYLTAQSGGDTWLGPVLRLQQEYDNAPIEVSNWRNSNLMGAHITQYVPSTYPTGFAYPGKTQAVNLQAVSGSFSNATVSGTTITRDSRYEDETSFVFSGGNIQQVTGRDGVPGSYIWDYANKEPIAKVVNATVDQVAYTSFEADGNGSWTIPSTARDTAAMTGNHSYNLGNGAISRSGLNSSNTYVVSYWSKQNTAYTLSGTTSTLKGKTIRGWTYFEHTVKGVSSLTISGGSNIDELRLYPSTAQMTTYTYRPGVGISSQCDVGNRITYYFYDSLGRLHHLKDQDGNIVKTVDYHYAGQ